MQPDKIPNWVLFLGFLFIILASGWLGQLDYQRERSDECYQQGKDYNADADLCVKLTKGEM